MSSQIIAEEGAEGEEEPTIQIICDKFCGEQIIRLLFLFIRARWEAKYDIFFALFSTYARFFAHCFVSLEHIQFVRVRTLW